MTTTTLPYTLDRIITIAAPRELVFEFLSRTDRWAAWWGNGSTIDPRVGGRVVVRHPNNIEFHGEVVEIDPPSRIVFTYGTPSGTPTSRPRMSPVPMRMIEFQSARPTSVAIGAPLPVR